MTAFIHPKLCILTNIILYRHFCPFLSVPRIFPASRGFRTSDRYIKPPLIAVFSAALCLFAVEEAFANNVNVTNAQLVDLDTAADTVKVQFDISWENSWRDAVNYDAVWMFIKYSTDTGTTWAHGTLKTSGTNPASFAQGTGTSIDIVVPGDLKGCFVQRSGNGTGTVSTAGMKIVWDYGADGVSDNDAKAVNTRIDIIAIEMVYVPETAFYIGDADGDVSNGFYEFGANAYQITSENALTVDAAAGELYYNDDTGDGNGGDALGPVPAAFPKGYAAFYVMKFELSQRQYCAFLNTLTAAQQASLFYPALYFNSFRNFIKKTAVLPATFGCDANGNAGDALNAFASGMDESNDGGWVACNYLSWSDGAAYCDWAALRPMTELEFEKVARGGQAAADDEYAWGNTTLEDAATSLTNANKNSESPDLGNANYSACAPNGPFRSGAFAFATSTRQNAGAGYYGVLDISGNLCERVVTIGDSTGRAFTGAHGDGRLTANGYADVANWPGLSNGEVVNAAGSGVRGGSWIDGSSSLRIADRSAAALTDTVRQSYYGFRGCRTAP